MGIRTKFNPMGGKSKDSVKVIDVVNGDSISSGLTVWVLMSNGDLYGTGSGSYGKQGNSSTSDVTIFTKRAENVKQVMANDGTTWYLTNDGDLYGCGHNDFGQQGNGSTSNVLKFTKRASNVSKFACSDSTTFYITNNGELYGCGCGDAFVSSSAKKSFERIITTRNVIDVACTRWNYFYIDSSNYVYGSGDAGYYQQGNNSTTDRSGQLYAWVNSSNVAMIGTKVMCTMQNTIVLDEPNQYMYFAGTVNGSATTVFRQTLVVKECAYPHNNSLWYIKNSTYDLYGMGKNNYGQQGNGSTTDVTNLTYISSNVKQVAASDSSTWYVRQNGDLYGTGSNTSSGTGSYYWSKQASNVDKVVCSNNAVYYIDTHGNLWGKGSGSNGEQGNGSTAGVATFENKMQYLQS